MLTAEQQPEVSAPDWNRIHFQVDCARCGHSLNGQVEPQCPSCELEFDWNEALPIEALTCPSCQYNLYGLKQTRCPECGEKFEWHRIINDFRVRKKPIFEYQWKRKRIRPFINSWKLALKPWTLWRTVDIHDPTPTSGFILLLIFQFVATFIAMFACATGFTLLSILASVPAPGGVWMITGNVTGPWFSFRELAILWTSATGFSVLWLIGILIGQLVLRQSMATCKIRNAHVMRVSIYAVLPICLYLPTNIVGWLLYDALMLYEVFFGELDLVSNLRDLVRLIQFFAAPIVVSIAIILQFISVYCGYRDYIRMRHALGVAATSTFIAILLSTITLVQIWLWF